MKMLILGVVVIFAIAAGETRGAKASEKTGASDDNYMEPLEILTRNCAACHQAADHPGAMFLNRARLSEPETIKLMIKLIETSEMPPAHKNFRTTKDGKKLLAWLKKQQKEVKAK